MSALGRKRTLADGCYRPPTGLKVRLPPPAQEREVKACTGTLQSLAIHLKLLSIALALAIKEGINVAAFMPACFVVDDPASAVGGAERAVNDVCAHAFFGVHAHTILGARFRLRAQEPATTLVRQRVLQRRCNNVRRSY